MPPGMLAHLPPAWSLATSAGPISVDGPAATACDSAWEYFAFLANSFVFILIGMNVADQPLGRSALAAGNRYSPGPRRARPVVYPLAASCSPIALAAARALSAHLVLGRLRGALALALALAVPATVPERGAIILTAFVVVAFSILVQG